MTTACGQPVLKDLDRLLGPALQARLEQIWDRRGRWHECNHYGSRNAERQDMGEPGVGQFIYPTEHNMQLMYPIADLIVKKTDLEELRDPEVTNNLKRDS